MKKFTIKKLQNMRESEDHVEFKRGDRGNISYNGAHKDTPKDRRRCIYIFDIPYFNEMVTREMVNNAFSHRDYRKNSEIVIKLYPARMDVINAGAFLMV